MAHTPFGSFYSEPTGGELERCLYPTRLDAYGCGCQHDCAYCYAKSLLSFRGLWHPEKPSVASVEYIRRKLDKIPKGSVIRLGGMTDCFQPYEAKYRATYQTLKMMNARGIGYLIVTKSDMVANAMYLDVLDPKLAHIQITVTSTSDSPNFFKEKATPPTKRIKAAEELERLGYDVALRVSPYVKELIDASEISKAKVSKCLVEFLRVNSWIEKWTGLKWPEHTLKSGNYRHLPLEKKVGMLKGFDFEQMTVCEDVPKHYEWFKENFNYNPSDCCNLRKEGSDGDVAEA